MKVCKVCQEELPITEFQIKNKKTGNRRTVCRSCRNNQHREWNLKNRDHVREYNRKYKREERKNPEKAEIDRAAYRRWREENIEYDKQRQRRYRQENPMLFAMYAANRRAQRRNAKGSFTLEEWAVLCDSFGGVCLACNESRRLTVDHVVPLSKGGTNSIENIQPLCQPCNSRKGANEKDYRLGG